MEKLFLIFFISVRFVVSLDHLDDSDKHLFHFLHVTDIHVTRFDHQDRIEQFEEFCNEIIVKLIKPPVTVVTGDLTHSRDPTFASEQYEDEWKTYQNILNRTNVTQSTRWLDTRGNHDVFMDPDPQSERSFYRTKLEREQFQFIRMSDQNLTLKFSISSIVGIQIIYSNQGQKHNGSYRYTYETKSGDTYSFLGLDMCPRPGAGRPFNFLGQISKNEMKTIKTLAEETKNSTSTITFGHYPLSFTYSEGLNDLINHSIVYLNGHLHLAIKHLYARHSNGLLELELGDWKDNRRFRLLTIDSGILSFEDFQYDQSIYAVISNPKAAKFQTPREPLERIRLSSHIRILIFSKRNLTEVRIEIDSTYLGNAYPSSSNRNLFILPWNTTKYDDGNLHEIIVTIRDEMNESRILQYDFSISKTMITSWTRSKFVLFIHWPTFGLTTFLIGLTIYVGILVFFRYRGKRMNSRCSGCFTFWNQFRLRMSILCSIDVFYYSLIIFAFYHLFGPWYIGYLTEGYFGAVFLWGTIIRGIYLPPDMQLFMGTIQFILFVIPLTLTLSSSTFYRYQTLHSSSNISQSRFSRFVRFSTVYFLFVYTIIFVMFWSYITTASYKFAWFLSPFGWSLALISIYLQWKTTRLETNDFHLIRSKINENDERPIVTESTETEEEEEENH